MNVKELNGNVIRQMKRVIYGNEEVLDKVMLGLFGDVHILLESVPGLAKTLLIEALQKAFSNAGASRVQMTPDLMPLDIIGTKVMEGGRLITKWGPIDGVNFLLVDEINRATPKTQSALLSVMQERKAQIETDVLHMRDPFFVLATQNPIEQEGTYPLPEAQLDRFGLKITMVYIDPEAEIKMAADVNLRRRGAQNIIEPVADVSVIPQAQRWIQENVYVSEAALRYIVMLVNGTRPATKDGKWKGEVFQSIVAKGGKFAQLQNLVQVGCSPRLTQTLVKLSSVRAAMDGRDFVLPEDIHYVLEDTMRHRIKMFEEVIEDEIPETVIELVRAATPLVPGDQHYRRPAAQPTA